MAKFENLGVDPLFPAGGELFKIDGFYINHLHGGPKSRAWLDKNFEARPDDIYVVSFPKTGTTWAQEMVYLIGNDLDFEKAKKPLQERFPYLELLPSIEANFITNVDKDKPRYLKSHYPYSLLPQSILDKKCKIIYTIRNPKDTLVSYYSFAIKNQFLLYNGDFETIFKMFIEEERLNCTPFSRHILECWDRRNEDNILILHFEDMKKDMVPAVRSVAKFLGKSLTDDQVQQVVEHCKFDNMSKNPSTNYSKVFSGFMRKGQVGDWKNFFTEELNEQMEEYVQRKFDKSGLKFEFGK